MHWQLKSFNQLSTSELYDIIKLRINIFVVEQNCPYSELDDKDHDPGALHLFVKKQGELIGYLRILPPGCIYPDKPSFGRVVTQGSARGTGIGHLLIERANQVLDQHWPGLICHISAQAHLQVFYQKHHFHAVGQAYLEDDIPHIGMERLCQ